MRFVTPAALLLLAAACMPYSFADRATEDQIRSRIAVKDSSFNTYVTIDGPSFDLPRTNINDPTGSFSLSTSRDRKSGVLTDRLTAFVVHRDSVRHTYRLATLDDASDLKLVLGDTSTDCRRAPCERWERILIELPPGLLASRAQSGFAVRAIGQSGHSVVVKVPGQYVRAMLAATQRN
ncbi:MAG: hypothetical protein FJZ01_21665 [Candidatus Sericytochromatia bacterium]|nr:hypothetical protein [Candidatus Tanganyikabacteria bacterium]